MAKNLVCPHCGHDEFTTNAVFRETIKFSVDKGGEIETEQVTMTFDEGMMDGIDQESTWCERCGVEVYIDDDKGIVEVGEPDIL